MTRADIAGIFGVPPHMIGDVERSTSWGSGIEQQSLGYVIYSLMPWLTRLERTVRQLLGDPNLYVKFDPDGLLRGDTTQRYSAYAQARQWGWMSVNDIRAKEDEEPVDGGDQYLQPLNMVPAGETAPPAQRSMPGRQERAADSAESVAAEDLPAWVRRHEEAVTAFFAEQSDRVLAELGVNPGASVAEILDEARENEDLTAVLLELARGLVAEVGASTAAALGGAFVVEETAAVLAAGAAATAANINATTVAALVTQFTVSNAPKDVLEMFERMTEARAKQLAMARVNYLSAFGAHEGAKHAGARTKTWRVWDPNPRASHAAADGQTVGIREDFTIGSHKGRWPHDYRLGVDEIAGCTCRLQFNL